MVLRTFVGAQLDFQNPMLEDVDGDLIGNIWLEIYLKNNLKVTLPILFLIQPSKVFSTIIKVSFKLTKII